MLIQTEQRLDNLTETSRQLLPKIKDVCALAVQEKAVNGSGSCDFRKIWSALSGGEHKTSYNKVGGDEDAPPRYGSARIEPEFDGEEEEA